MNATRRHNALTEPTLMILLALWSKPLHGYGIRRTVRALSRGRILLGNGTVYETLPRLEQVGWIHAVEDTEPGHGHRERHLYELTETGREALREEHARLSTICRLMAETGITEPPATS